MKVNHAVCKSCIYSEVIKNIGYVCAKDEKADCHTLELIKFDCKDYKKL